MGRKVKSGALKANVLVEKDETEKAEQFQLNLNALDGYDLPQSGIESSDSDNDDRQPKRKRPKKARHTKVLGMDYREKEERRLEQLLFGDLVQKFELDSTSDKKSEPPLPDTKKPNKKKKKTVPDSLEVLPEDKFGNTLADGSLVQRNPVWVDEDDEKIR